MFLVGLLEHDFGGLRIKMQPNEFCTFLGLTYTDSKSKNHPGRKVVPPSRFNFHREADKHLLAYLKECFVEVFGNPPPPTERGASEWVPSDEHARNWKLISDLFGAGSFFFPESVDSERLEDAELEDDPLDFTDVLGMVAPRVETNDSPFKKRQRSNYEDSLKLPTSSQGLSRHRQVQANDSRY